MHTNLYVSGWYISDEFGSRNVRFCCYIASEPFEWPKLLLLLWAAGSWWSTQKFGMRRPSHSGDRDRRRCREMHASNCQDARKHWSAFVWSRAVMAAGPGDKSNDNGNASSQRQWSHFSTGCQRTEAGAAKSYGASFEACTKKKAGFFWSAHGWTTGKTPKCTYFIDL